MGHNKNLIADCGKFWIVAVSNGDGESTASDVFLDGIYLNNKSGQGGWKISMVRFPSIFFGENYLE